MVQLQRVDVKEKQVLQHIMQFYIYEFSKYIPTIRLDLNGAYEPFQLDRYWDSDNYHPFFIKLDDELIGFALVESATGSSLNTIQEFFIMAKHNGNGYGKQIARELFRMFPGEWEITQIENNKPAQAFWRGVINEVTDGNFTERYEDGKYIQSFTTWDAGTGPLSRCK